MTRSADTDQTRDDVTGHLRAKHPEDEGPGPVEDRAPDTEEDEDDVQGHTFELFPNIEGRTDNPPN